MPAPDTLNDAAKAEALSVLSALRNKGFAVVLFNPSELGEVDPGTVEDLLVERGNEIIATLTGQT